MPEIEIDPACHAINLASYAAANAVYEYASKFDRREDYRPLEKLAQEVQRLVVQTGARALQNAEEAQDARD